VHDLNEQLLAYFNVVSSVSISDKLLQYANPYSPMDVNETSPSVLVNDVHPHNAQFPIDDAFLASTDVRATSFANM
jgi:hypothetical protein